MLAYLLSVGIVFLVLLTGVVVQRTYLRFAARHPELGPFREERGGGGCCGGCGDGTCAKQDPP